MVKKMTQDRLVPREPPWVIANDERAPFCRLRQRRALEQNQLRRGAHVERDFHRHIARSQTPESYKRLLLALEQIGADQFLIVETNRLDARPGRDADAEEKTATAAAQHAAHHGRPALRRDLLYGEARRSQMLPGRGLESPSPLYRRELLIVLVLLRKALSL